MTDELVLKAQKKNFKHNDGKTGSTKNFSKDKLGHRLSLPHRTTCKQYVTQHTPTKIVTTTKWERAAKGGLTAVAIPEAQHAHGRLICPSDGKPVSE